MRATRWAGAAVVLAGAGWAAGRIAKGPAGRIARGPADRRSREPGGVAEADWERIEAILWLSWRSLAGELRAARPAR
jgi:hypothetical protein